MGIKNLNKFLIDNCKKSSIKRTHLSELESKTIVIDTSIYLYKFAADGTLLEHFYLMISIFHHYKIIPIFIFDGKPPKEKRALLIQRRNLRLESEKQYQIKKAELEQVDDIDEKLELEKEIEILKRDATSISYDDLAIVKKLMTAYGVKYYCAEGEADILCAQMVLSGKAWGCMSDDMDMFLYGCNRVFRNFSLLHHNVMEYNMDAILEDLDMKLVAFREIAVLSGTDYNINLHIDIYILFVLYKKYTLLENNIQDKIPFYSWVIEKSGELFSNDMEILNYHSIYTYNTSIFKLFDIDIYANVNQTFLEDSPSQHIEINMEDLKSIMETDGFVFVQ
jgi:hypothetical protein